MAINMFSFLYNDRHLKPLLDYYLAQYYDDPEKIKSYTEPGLPIENPEFIINPDDSITGFRVDVIIEENGKAGAFNIRDGYLRILANCLEHDLSPSKIKVVSIINHNKSHWTCSIAEFDIEPNFFKELQEIFTENPAMKGSYNARNLIYNAMNRKLHPDQNNIEIGDDFRLFGTNKIKIKHYDSHQGELMKKYYTNYEKNLTPLISANPKIISIEQARCTEQEKNTCGDHSLWNGFMNGVLGLPLDQDGAQIDSNTLRAFTESLSPDVEEDKRYTEVRLAFSERVKKNIQLSKNKAKGIGSNEDKKSKEEYIIAAPVITTQPNPVITTQKPLDQKPEPVERRSAPVGLADLSKANKANFQRLLQKFGNESENQICKNIISKYQEKRTEKRLMGILQKAYVATTLKTLSTKRDRQIKSLAKTMYNLQIDIGLNDHEKGVILYGAIQTIIDDIHHTEKKNVFHSRLEKICKKMKDDLKKSGISPENSSISKVLYHVYDTSESNRIEKFKKASMT